ncbi:MAG: AAA family ATPase [Thermoplasmata archaeon]|nr:AAA family ATPase [Thermoplasmata archaeon]
MGKTERSEVTVNNGDVDIEDMRVPPIGYDDFIEVRDGDLLYVDKSALIDRILSEKFKAYLFTRPRRFGKSLNLSMLDAYLNLEYKDHAGKWFDGLEITRLRPDDPEMNAYPVVFVNFKDLDGKDMQTIQCSLRDLIADLYENFDYLAESESLTRTQKLRFDSCVGMTADLSTLVSAVKNLCRMLERHHKRKVVLLIDEYDRVVNSAYGKPYQKEVLELISGILSPALKSNTSLKFAVVTGVMQIAKDGIFSGFNNAYVDNVLDTQFDEMFGFTADDIKTILGDGEHPEKFGEVREWYDGYRFGNADIYNPWSVLIYVSKGFETGSTGWALTGSTQIVVDMIQRSGPKAYSDILAMSNGGIISHKVDPAITFDQMSSGTDALYSIMVMSGYLKAVPDGSGSYILSAPNREISGFLMETLIKMAGAAGSADELKDSTFSRNVKRLKDAIQEYLVPMSHSDLKWESSYKDMLYGAYRALCPYHRVYPDPRAGNGFSDITMERVKGDQPNVVIEFKRIDPDSNPSQERLLKVAEEGLAQIRDRDYPRTLKGRTILYGMAFHKKDVEIVKEEIDKG